MQYLLFNFHTSPDWKQYFDQNKTICARLGQARIIKVIVEIFIVQFQESLKSVSLGNAGIFQREIDGLKLKRREVETSVESIIQTLRNTLEFVRDQDTREREDKILLHRPRHTDQEAKTG